MRISHKIAILIGLSVFITSVIFSIGIYVEKKNALLDGIDRKLYAAALFARELLGEEYHDNIVDRNSIESARYLETIERNNRLCRQLGLQSLWSLMEVDGTIVFTSSTSTRHDVKNNDHAIFFDTHRIPLIYRKVFASMEPRYQINPDRWGDVRAALIPFMDKQGRKYLFAASMRTADVDSLVMKTLGRSILISLSILAAGMAVGIFFVAEKFSRHIVNLKQAAEAIAGGDLDKRVALAGSLEIRSLASSINRMSGAIKEQMRAIEQSRENLSITLNSIGDAVITTDASAKVTRMNPVAEALTGWSLQEAMGKPLTDVFRLVDTATGRSVENPADRVLQERAIVDLPAGTTLVAKGGTLLQIADSGAPIRDARNSILGVVIVFRDVTGRNLADAERRRLSAIMENTTDMVALIAPDETITYLNPAGTRMLGWDEDLGKEKGRIREIHPPWAMTLIHGEGIPCAMKKGVWSGETAVIHSSGREIPVSQVIMAHRAENGELQYLSTIIRDISERKHFEEELKRFRFALDNSGDALFIIDPKSMAFVDVNREACTSLGFTRDELLTMGPHDIKPEFPEKKLSEIFDRVIESGASITLDTVHRRKDGTKFPVESPLRSMETAEGTFIIEPVRDMTERMAAKQDMRRLRKYLNNIVDSMPSMLVGVDGTGVVTLWNRETGKRTGIPQDRALGRDLESVFPFKGIDRARIALTMEQGIPRQEGRFSMAQDGVTRYFDVTLYPLLEGGIQGVVIRMDDVTESTRINELLVQSEKMLSVGGLAAGMAHEINNPLGVVMGSAQSLARRFSPDLKKNRAVAEELGIDLDRVRDYMGKRDITGYIEAIAQAGERAAHIVRNMLEFGRKSKPVRAQHPIQTLIDKAVDLAARDYDLVKRYDFETIPIEREYDSEIPLMWLIETEIEQVFLNLLKNAVQAMAEKAYEEESPLIVIRVLKEGLSARIEFEDNGPGMEENVRKRIFEPFFSTKEVGTGTGLGLSVAYFIITQNHRGQFSVESEPGRGTRFIIHLPLENRAS